MEVTLGLLVGLLLALSSLSWGCLARRILPPDAPLVHYWAVGLALLAAAAGGLALAGWLYPVPLFLIVLVPALARGPEARRGLAELRGLAEPTGGKLCLALLAAIWFLVSLGSLAPNTHWDVEMYHYTLPRLYLSEHRFYWTGTSIYDGVFQFTHLLYLPALALGGEVAANLWGPILLALLCLAAASATLSQDRHPPLAPQLAMLLVCTSPIVFLQGYGGLMDVPAALWCMLALDAWLRSRRQPGWLPWLGVWCGLALATKITAGLSLLALGLATLLTREGWKWKLRVWIAAVVGGLLLSSPWLVRNWIHTGAPIYPLVRPGLNVPAPKPPTASQAAASTAAPGLADRFVTAPPPTPALRFIPSLITLNWRQRDWQQAFNPCLLTGLLLSRAGSLWLPGLFTALLATLVGVADHRYALGGTLWLAVPVALGLARSGKRIVYAALSATFALALVGLSGSLLWRLPVILGLESRNNYLARIDPLHAAFDFLGGQPHSAGDRAWLMDPRGYRCPVPFVVVDHANGPQSWDDLDRPRWIVWNFARPAAAAQLAFWTLHELGPGHHQRASLGILQLLPEALLQPALRRNGAVPEAGGLWQQGVPRWRIPLHPKVVTLTRQGRVIYQQGLIVIVEVPTSR